MTSWLEWLGGWFERLTRNKQFLRLRQALVVLVAIILFAGVRSCGNHKAAKPPHKRPAHVARQPHRRWTRRTARPAKRPATWGPIVQAPAAPVGIRCPAMPMKPLRGGPLGRFLVIIDPGHGGQRDQGSTFAPGFLESAYTYKAAWELGEMLRQQGASVYLTAWSCQMMAPDPKIAALPRALPRDARITLTGEPLAGKNRGLRARVECVQAVAKSWGGGKKLIFISLHTDSEAPTVYGGHVCVNAGRPAPRLAELIAARLVASKRGWVKRGKMTSSLSFRDPTPGQRMRLHVLAANPIEQKCLVELATATAPHDSWRVRSARNRHALLREIVKAFDQFAAERR